MVSKMRHWLSAYHGSPQTQSVVPNDCIGEERSLLRLEVVCFILLFQNHMNFY